jgi:hypothetical protein
MSRRWIIVGLGCAFLLIIVLVYSFFDPSNSNFFPKCPFLLLTGLKCPGCGSQRAIHALLKGDVIAAIRFNAMMVAFIPLIIVLLYAEFQRTRKPKLYLLVNSNVIVWTIFTIVIGWWILRNIFGW